MKKKRTCVGSDRWNPLRKMLIFMKFLWILLFGVCMSVQADVYSQQMKVNLNMQDVPLSEVMKELSKQTKLDFLYNYNLMGSKGRINIKAENKELVSVLEELLTGLGLEYTFDDKVVVIREKAFTPQGTEYRIEGKVLDNKKQPLPGVTILLDSTSIGTSTKVDGTFLLRLPINKGTLIVSFIGFKMKRVPFEAGKPLVIIMDEDVTDLDEVVVRAYGTQNKRETISAMSTITAEEMKEIPSASLENLLQGRLAGVNVINQSGAPGSAANVTIRGFNSLMDSNAKGASDGQPLYVVDGIPMHSFTAPLTGTNTMADLDPSMIESVTVLKDASASSIYGSRAANGVILITTKKGKAGRSVFSANVSYSLSQLMEYPEQTGGRMERWLDILSKRGKRSAYFDFFTYTSIYPDSYNEVYQTMNGVYDAFWGNGGKTIALDKPLQDSLNPFYNNSTNWWKYAFRTGKVLNANIQTSGGSETIQYMIGAGYYTETGIMKNSNYARANLITNLTVHPTERLRVTSRNYLSYVDKTASNFLSRSNGNYEGLTVNPALMSTLEPAGGVAYDYWMRANEGIESKVDNYRLMTSLALEYEILKGLTLSASGNIDYSQINSNKFTPSTLDNSANPENKTEGDVSRSIYISTEELLRYKTQINNDHNLEVLLGFDANKTQNHGIGGMGRRGASDYVYYYDSDNNPPIYNYGTESSPNIKSTTTYNSSFREKAMVSYFARLSYNYKQRYLIEGTYRRDGSSTFGEDHRWADFPSVAVGWTFSQEPFMDWAKNWLDWGKLRGSFGTSGKTFTDEYLAHGLIGQNDKLFLGNGGTQALEGVSPDLTWEKSRQYDIGLDLDMFNHRVNVKFDYYYKYTSSLLYTIKLPGNIFGVNERTENAMELSNEGIELEIKADILQNSAIQWRTRFNISRNWNRFEKSYDGKDKNSLIIGLPLYQLYVYDDEGYYQSEDEVPFYYATNGQPTYLSGYSVVGVSGLIGTYKLKDLDNDNYVNVNNDRYFAGSPVTLFHGGWVNELSWKDLDLTMLFNFGVGRKIINYRIETMNRAGAKMFDVSGKTFWQQAGDETDFPRYGSTVIAGLRSNIENVHNITLKQLTLGYNLPKNLANKCYLSGLRMFLTVENLFYLSNYSGGNPETVNVYTGIDNGESYPLPRKWTMGLTLNF